MDHKDTHAERVRRDGSPGGGTCPGGRQDTRL